MDKKKVGLIVNPIAGMGGKVGLKGTDGKDTLKKAIELGAIPVTPGRVVQTLSRMEIIKDNIELLTYPGDMGEFIARKCGFDPTVIGTTLNTETSAVDTKNAAIKMKEMNADLILFAGGDGTARNIYDAVGTQIPVIGIPCGVKIHSAVYATNPTSAGDLVTMFLNGKILLKESEVMDIDEVAFREGRVSAQLYGYLKVPFEKHLVQGMKSSSRGEVSLLDGMCSNIIENLQEDSYYILGPGTTTKSICDKMGLEKTLLGVDVIYKGKIVAHDTSEKQLIELTSGKKAKIIVTPIGGQGYIFGRGNQQISADIIKIIGKKNIIVVATKSKILSLNGRPLLVDTGDDKVNRTLTGYIRVLVGYNDEIIYRVAG